MFKILILLILFSSAQAFANRSSCLSYASRKIEIMESKNIYLSNFVQESISANVYYFCELDLKGVDSWVCLDRGTRFGMIKSDVIHLSPEFEIWFTGPRDGSSSPQIALYREDVEARSSRLNTFILEDDYKLVLERKPKDYKLNGMVIDNREGSQRSFKNIECFDVKGLTSY